MYANYRRTCGRCTLYYTDLSLCTHPSVLLFSIQCIGRKVLRWLGSTYLFGRFSCNVLFSKIPIWITIRWCRVFNSGPWLTMLSLNASILIFLHYKKLYINLARPIHECGSEVWSLSYRCYVMLDSIEFVQKQFLLLGFRNLDYDPRLLALPSLEKRRFTFGVSFLIRLINRTIDRFPKNFIFMKLRQCKYNYERFTLLRLVCRNLNDVYRLIPDSISDSLRCTKTTMLCLCRCNLNTLTHLIRKWTGVVHRYRLPSVCMYWIVLGVHTQLGSVAAVDVPLC